MEGGSGITVEEGGGMDFYVLRGTVRTIIQRDLMVTTASKGRTVMIIRDYRVGPMER